MYVCACARVKCVKTSKTQCYESDRMEIQQTFFLDQQKAREAFSSIHPFTSLLCVEFCRFVPLLNCLCLQTVSVCRSH